MGASDGAKCLWARDPDEPAELAQVIFVGFPGIGVAQISKPLDFRGNISEFDELGGCERLPFSRTTSTSFIHRSSFPGSDPTRDNGLYEGSPPV